MYCCFVEALCSDLKPQGIKLTTEHGLLNSARMIFIHCIYGLSNTANMAVVCQLMISSIKDYLKKLKYKEYVENTIFITNNGLPEPRALY